MLYCLKSSYYLIHKSSMKVPQKCLRAISIYNACKYNRDHLYFQKKNLPSIKKKIFPVSTSQERGVLYFSLK